MKDFVGNQTAIKYLEEAVKTDNLAHAYLFCGPEGVGKTKAGAYLAKMLLCEGNDPVVCSGCPSCKLFESGNHPDFFHFDQETVLVDEIRELIGSLELKSYFGKGKVALISHAERLTNQALNSFLKTLEEPTVKTTIILTAENKKNLLPTIVSRARILNFGLAPDKQVFELVNGELGVKQDDSVKITKLAAGRIGIATTLASDIGQVEEKITLSNDFYQIYKSQDIHEKIFFADKITKEKGSLLEKLQDFEISIRGELFRMNLDESKIVVANDLVVLLDKIARSREMINKNANAKLVMEGLLLGSMI